MVARAVTVGGETRTLAEWAKLKGLAAATIRSRIDKQGWDPERAVNTPPDHRFRHGGRPRADAPRPCPQLKRHPTGQAWVRWRFGGRTLCRYFGPFGSDQANAAYQRFAVEWAEGRQTPVAPITSAGPMVGELVRRWLDWSESEYRKGGKITSEVHGCRAAAGPLRDLYGDTPAADFGPNQFRAVRRAMIQRGWARKTVNIHCSRVVRMFKWATGRGLLAATVWQALAAVEWLKAGRSAAYEPEK
jgi:hypothetical protein